MKKGLSIQTTVASSVNRLAKKEQPKEVKNNSSKADTFEATNNQDSANLSKKALEGFKSKSSSIKNIKPISSNTLEITFDSNDKNIKSTAKINSDLEITNLKINGFEFNYSKSPIKAERFDRVAENTSSALENINSRFEFRRIDPSKFKLSSKNGFFIDTEVNGRKFIASPIDIVEVLEESKPLTKKELEELKTISEKIKSLEKNFIAEICPFPQGSKEAAQWYKEKKAEYKKNKEKIKATQEEIISLEIQSYKIKNRQFKSILQNECKDQIIQFNKKYETTRTLKNEKGNTATVETYRSENDIPYLKDKTFFSKGEKAYTENYNLDGSIKSRVRYGENGKVSHSDYYENGEIKYRETESTYRNFTTNATLKHRLFPIHSGTQFIDPIKGDINVLIDKLDTKEKYDSFEKDFLRNLSYQMPKDKLKALRDHGKKLYGVDKLLLNLNKALEEKGLSINIKDSIDTYESVSGEMSSIKDLGKDLAKLSTELEMYPKELLQSVGLKNIYLMKKLFVGKEPVNGVQVGTNMYLAKVTNRIFHHEFLHGIDHADGKTHTDNDDWQARFHGEGKVYLNYTNRGDTWGVNSKGFVRSYGRRNANEDQATSAENLFDRVKHLNMLEIAKKDQLVKEKIGAIKRLYYRMSAGRIDEQYWQDLLNGEIIDSSYWSKRESNGDFENPKVKQLESYLAFDAKMKKVDLKEIEKNPKEAIKFFTNACEQNPYNEEYRNFLSNAYLDEDLNPDKQMLKINEQRLKEIPEIDHWPSYYKDLSNSYAANNNTNKAVETYEKGLSLFPRDTKMKKDLVELILEITKNETNDSKKKELLEKAKKCNKELLDKFSSKSILINQISINNSLGKKENNVDITLNYLKNNSNDASIRDYFERLMVNLGRSEEIITQYKELGKEKPIEAGIMIAKFQLLKLKDPIAAEKTYKDLIAKNSDNTILLKGYIDHSFTRIKTTNKEEGFKIRDELISTLFEATKASKNPQVAELYVDRYYLDKNAEKNLPEIIKTFEPDYIKSKENARQRVILGKNIEVYNQATFKLARVYSENKENTKLYNLLMNCKKIQGENFKHYEWLVLACQDLEKYDEGIKISNEALNNKTYTDNSRWLEDKFNQEIFYFNLLNKKQYTWSKPDKDGKQYAVSSEKGFENCIFIKNNKFKVYEMLKQGRGAGWRIAWGKDNPILFADYTPGELPKKLAP